MSKRIIDRDQVIEFDPDYIDSTTIRYLNREQLTKAELNICIDKLLAEVRQLEQELHGSSDFLGSLDDDDPAFSV